MSAVIEREIVGEPGSVSPVTSATSALLEVEDVRKSFGGVHALRGVTLSVRAGEIHALLGENGAGKSTLVKILAGALRRDAGTVRWNGADEQIGTLADADRLGIRVIHQHLNVVDHLSVAANVMLGREPRRMGVIDHRALRRQATDALKRLGVALDPDAPGSGLRVAEKQLVEIARALSSGETRVLIMDEPTASLGDREVERLFDVVRSLQGRGIAIIYISHKLDEILRLVNRVTVVRDGATVGTVEAAATTREELVTMMVGRELSHAVAHRSQRRDRVVLSCEDLVTATGLRGVSLDLHEGEILGVYGLLGSGRTELARAIFGADRIVSGSVRVNGELTSFRSPVEAAKGGIGLVPEERSQAVFPWLTLRENITAASERKVFRRGLLRARTERALTEEMMQSLRVRAPSQEQLLGRLSGGNQQKIVLGRWLLRGSPVLILDDPTVGVDVGAKAEIYEMISRMTEQGTAVLLSSSELPELLLLADRMIVLHEGRVADTLEPPDLTEENVLNLALGAHDQRSDGASAKETR